MIMRKSVSTFLKHFQYFTTTPVLLLLPFSSSVLFSQPLFSSYDISLLHASRFSVSKFTFFFNQKYMFISSSIFVIPFALSSLLIAKASVIRHLNPHKLRSSETPLFSCLPLYKPLFLTQLFNIILGISINTTSIFLLLRIFSCFGSFGLFDAVFQTVCGLVLYAFVTHVTLLCNLALVVAGMENCYGYKAIYKACLLRAGRNSRALIFWAFPTSLSLASVEALFCFRLVRSSSYPLNKRPCLSVALEGLLIAYLYSIIIVLDTIACCFFIKSYTSDSSTENENGICNQIELV